MVEKDDRIPPGWDYNPSAWSQRLPIIVLAIVGFGIATYLALWQYELFARVWEPVFGDGLEVILDSDLSYVIPFGITDAALGAFAYLLDAVTGVIGGRRRWRTMPWIVIVFAIFVGPLGAVSIGLVIAQPLMYDAWCTLCLVSAVVSVLMIGPAMDEALASLQYMKRVKAAGGPVWRTFWGLADQERVLSVEEAPPKRPREMFERFNIPLNQVAIWAQGFAALAGIWLLMAPWALGYAGSAAADADRVVGPLVATFGCVAMWEATRSVRWWNMPLAAWLIVGPWLAGFPTAAAVNALITGLVIAGLSLIRGRIKHRFAGGWPVLWKHDPYHVADRAMAA